MLFTPEKYKFILLDITLEKYKYKYIFFQFRTFVWKYCSVLLRLLQPSLYHIHHNVKNLIKKNGKL